MGLLDGKVALLFGLANKHSIAWGICESLHREGAQLAVSYGIERLEKRARPLAESVGAKVIELCDVRNDEQLDHVFKRVEEEHGKIDILIHSVAYAQKDDLIGRYVDTSREGFATALDVSVYSLVGMAKRAEPLMAPGSSILTMTYYGGVKVVPNYNIMGICKAALEMSVRYLSADLGPKQIRVNAISAGPIKTLAASGISDFNRLLDIHAGAAPLRRNVEIGEVGDTAVWLSSDWASAVTGQIIYADSGWNILGMSEPYDPVAAQKEKEEALKQAQAASS